MAQPRTVSVVVPTRDRPDFLDEALQSIRALEGADLTFEILIGDNGSDPRTKEIAEKHRALYAHTPKNGSPAARNICFERATGEFIAFLDDDDVWLPGNIRAQIQFLDAHPDHAGAVAQIISTDQDLNPLNAPWPQEVPADGDLFKMLLSGYFPQLGGSVYRAEALTKHGLMDESLIGDADWDWQIRIATTDKIGFVPVHAILFRQRPGGSFNKLQMMRSGYTRRVFLRHALPHRDRWENWRELVRSYYGCQMYYWEYFLELAAKRADAGERWGVVKAISSAFWIFPTRTLRYLIGETDLRRAASRIFA